MNIGKKWVVNMTEILSGIKHNYLLRDSELRALFITKLNCVSQIGNSYYSFI